MHLPVFDYALTILSYNPKTIAMMKKTLLIKGYNLDEVEHCIEKLCEQWYLDDYAFCKAYFQSEVINKWKSVNAIKKKMYEKGMPSDIITQVLEELGDDIEDHRYENLAKDIQKLHNQWHDLVKIYEKLTRKWHRYDDIKWALEYLNEKKKSH